MLRKNYKSLYNNLFLMLSIFLLVSSVHCCSLEPCSLNVNEQSITETFNINKVENYTYNLSYVHYGNIQEGMYVKIFVNGNFIHEYSKDMFNIGSGAYKKSENGVDITNYLINGANEFRVEANIWKTENSSPYYVVNDITISEPLKVPVSVNTNILIFILCSTVLIIKVIK
ncbi:hypothetical protein [Methanococcus sp. CF]